MVVSNRSASQNSGGLFMSIYEVYEQSWLPSIPNILIILATLSIVVATTRILSGLEHRPRANPDRKAHAVPILPYWFPVLGHLLQLGLTPDRLLKGTRERLSHGIFALNLAGTTHNIVYTPVLTTNVFSQKPSVYDERSIIWGMLVSMFGVPAKYKKQYYDAIHSLNGALSPHLLREPAMSLLADRTAKKLEEETPNLVSFLPSLVDQSPWERGADAVVTGSGEEFAMEVNLLQLCLDFVGHQALPSIFGSDLLRNYPNILSDLWVWNSVILLMAAGLPHWIPIPALSRGYAARARIQSALNDFHIALDKYVEEEELGSEWQNLEDVSSLLRARHDIFRKHNIPRSGQGEIPLLWALSANSNYLVFWMLLHIASDKALLADIRKEIAPYAKVMVSSHALAIQEQPRLSLNHRALVSKCALLKSCYIETLRLDSAPWSIKQVREDIIISEPNSVDQHPDSFLLRKGSYVDVAFDLHFSDPRYFRDPEKFIPDRHIRHESSVSSTNADSTKTTTSDTDGRTADWSTVRPYGGGASMCKGRLFAEREVMASVAAILVMWDLEPVDAKGWQFPSRGKATAVSMPKHDVRVRIKKRREAWSL